MAGFARITLGCALLAASPAFAGGPPTPPKATPAAEIAPAAPPPKVEAPVLVDIRAFGDSGYIGGVGVFGEPGVDYVKKHLRGVEALRSDDVNFLNLEGSLTRSCKDFELKPFSFAVSPEALTQFGQWGFNLIGLANNHSLDCQDPTPSSEINKAMAIVHAQVPELAAHGVASTWQKLTGNVARLEQKGVTLGMVSLKAWDTGPKSYIGNSGNRFELFKALKKSGVDVRILSLHGGIENTRRPPVELMDIARDFVARYDGDIVFAHHPHKYQGVEIIHKPNGKTAVIFYSLGNSLHNGLSAGGDGMAARVAVGKKGVDLDSLAVFPLASASRFPRPLAAKEAPSALAVLRASSTVIALRPLPKGLKRVAFAFTPIKAPVAGFALEAEAPAPVKEARAKIKKSIQRPKAHRAVSRAAKRRVGWVSATYDWIFK